MVSRQNCQTKFEDVASSPDFTFVGNVSIGPQRGGGMSVPLAALLPRYDGLVFAYGAARDRLLGIPGEESLGSIYSARQLVGWYNGLPGLDAPSLASDLAAADEAVVVGNGNVALDVARMLLEKVDSLRATDMPDYALDALSRSRVKRVHVVGRRGPMQVRETGKPWSV